MQLRQRVTPESEELEIAGTSFNPPRFRARAGTTLALGAWSATATANIIGTATNTYATSQPSVASWTTIDAQLRYLVPAGNTLSGLQASVSVRNLFNRDPPYVLFDTYIPGFHYDPVNASPLGRFVTVQLSKAW